MTVLPPPRGIRNDNPGNIRNSLLYEWDGQVSCDANGFCVFRRAEYGIRAMALLMMHYEEYEKIETVSGLIRRWAPPATNDLTSYIPYVAGRCGVGVYEIIKLTDYLPCLVQAIIVRENGYCPYDSCEIKHGIALARTQ